MLLPLIMTMAAPAEAEFYIGTYTAKNGSQGIYHARLNEKTGEISTPELAVEADNPSYIAVHKGFVYAVHENREGQASAYKIEKDFKLTLLNSRPSSGDANCHISVDSKGKYIFTSGYMSGKIACHPIETDGSLAEATQMVQNSGSGPDKSRQEGPHLHAAYADPRSKFVYACDLGTDEVLTYQFDSKKGTLAPLPSGKVPPGGGPRHLAFAKKGHFAYANNEMGNAVTTFSVDQKTGALTALQTISTLPEDHGASHTAEILVHPNGKWLYVSNRGNESLAVYSIGNDGLLTLVEIAEATVREPRGFEIDPTGHWLVVGGQNSNDITSLAIDPKTGKLTSSGHRVSLGSPVCIAFKR